MDVEKTQLPSKKHLAISSFFRSPRGDRDWAVGSGWLRSSRTSLGNSCRSIPPSA